MSRLLALCFIFILFLASQGQFMQFNWLAIAMLDFAFTFAGRGRHHLHNKIFEFFLDVW